MELLCSLRKAGTSHFGKLENLEKGKSGTGSPECHKIASQNRKERILFPAQLMKARHETAKRKQYFQVQFQHQKNGFDRQRSGGHLWEVQGRHHSKRFRGGVDGLSASTAAGSTMHFTHEDPLHFMAVLLLASALQGCVFSCTRHFQLCSFCQLYFQCESPGCVQHQIPSHKDHI